MGAVRGFGWLTDRPPGDRRLTARRGRRPRLDRPPAALPRRAELIPGARFEVMEEAHQPFQEVPDGWNARVDAFWRQIEMRD